MMELGQITVAEIFLTAVSMIGGGWLIWVFLKRKTDTKNTLKGNISGGSIAGGSIIKNSGPGQNEGAEVSKHRNVLKNNTAAGDIAGGDIKK
jgi:hypothetical protein